MTGESRWEVGWLARSPSARLGAAAIFGVLLAFTRNITLPGTLLVILAGVLVWMVDPESGPIDAVGPLDDPDPSVPGATRSGMLVWGGVILVFLLWEAAAFLLGNNEAHPTFSMLSAPVLGWPPIRALAGFGWMSWGWQLRAR